MGSKVFVILLVLVFLSCNSSKRSQDDFSKTTKEFLTAFNNKDAQTIDKFVDQSIGFFVLDNPGAYIIAEYFTSYQQIMILDGEYGVSYLNQMKINCEKMNYGILPYYACDDGEIEGWDKEGCFYGKSPSPGIGKQLDALWNFDLIDKTSYYLFIDDARKIDGMITHFVYNTDNSVGFYFGMINGKWRLLCIDKVVPCSA